MNVLTINKENLVLFRSLFRTREDVYAKFWSDPSVSKSGYSPVYNLNSSEPILTDAVIASHLVGKEVIGIYPLFPDNTTSFLVIDFDGENWLREAVSVYKAAYNHKIPCYLERSKSGNGGHLWFFFKELISAKKARQLGKYLLVSAGINSREIYDRMFPSQDAHKGKGFGNLIAIPLQGSYLPQGNTAFITEYGDMYVNQWEYLKSFVKISEVDIDFVLSTTRIKLDTFDKVLKGAENPSGDINNVELKINPSPKIKVILSNQIHIPLESLPDDLHKFLKKKLDFLNPRFHELKQRGYPTWNTTIVFKNMEVTNTELLVPAGFLENIKEFAFTNNLDLLLEDRQKVFEPLDFKSNLTLRENQKEIAEEIITKDRSVLEAKPGFGKTVVALYCLKERRQPTLILVHTKALLSQWQKVIEEFFELNDGDLGIIGEAKWSLGEKITIASYQTLARRDLSIIADKFGFIIVDECHHVPAKTFTDVIKRFSAKYVLGLTATAFRRDRLERLMTFYVGPVLKAAKLSLNRNEGEHSETKVVTSLESRKTNFLVPREINEDFQEICTRLIKDAERNNLLIDDIAKVLDAKNKCLVLTERVEHCEILLSLLRKKIKGVHAGTVTGRVTRKKREALMKRLKGERFQLLIATGKIIGEGFDWPELNHLFLAFPFSWKGKLIQYIGRVQRFYKDKNIVFIHDYMDYEVPILKIMYFKRLKTYKSLGVVTEISLTKSDLAKSKDQLPLLM